MAPLHVGDLCARCEQAGSKRGGGEQMARNGTRTNDRRSDAMLDELRATLDE